MMNRRVYLLDSPKTRVKVLENIVDHVTYVFVV